MACFQESLWDWLGMGIKSINDYTTFHAARPGNPQVGALLQQHISSCVQSVTDKPQI